MFFGAISGAAGASDSPTEEVSGDSAGAAVSRAGRFSGILRLETSWENPLAVTKMARPARSKKQGERRVSGKRCVLFRAGKTFKQTRFFGKGHPIN